MTNMDRIECDCASDCIGKRLWMNGSLFQQEGSWFVFNLFLNTVKNDVQQDS